MKSVVQLRNVRFTADRDDLQLSSFASISPNPFVRTFVIQFVKDVDGAISHFFDKSGTRDDPTVLGQLSFRMLDLDKATLGDYFSRRTSKVVLKRSLGASHSTECGSTRRSMCSLSPFISLFLLDTLIILIMCPTLSLAADTSERGSLYLQQGPCHLACSCYVPSLVTFYYRASYIIQIQFCEHDT